MGGGLREVDLFANAQLNQYSKAKDFSWEGIEKKTAYVPCLEKISVQKESIRKKKKKEYVTCKFHSATPLA